jgi:hypothetical protein
MNSEIEQVNKLPLLLQMPAFPYFVFGSDNDVLTGKPTGATTTRPLLRAEKRLHP